MVAIRRPIGKALLKASGSWLSELHGNTALPRFSHKILYFPTGTDCLLTFSPSTFLGFCECPHSTNFFASKFLPFFLQQMEVNKDEALRCLDIARRHLQNANFASARKFGNKSISLYPTPDATQFLSTVDKVEKAANATSSSSTSSSSTKTSSTSSSQANASSASASSRPQPARARSTPVMEHKPVERDYTPEQAAAVKTIRSSGGDFYKVLGVSKTATDVEIKKAYRKVYSCSDGMEQETLDNQRQDQH